MESERVDFPRCVNGDRAAAPGRFLNKHGARGAEWPLSVRERRTCG